MSLDISARGSICAHGPVDRDMEELFFLLNESDSALEDEVLDLELELPSLIADEFATSSPPQSSEAQRSDSDEDCEFEIVGARQALPSPPLCHPHTGAMNCVDTSMYTDTDTMYDVYTLLDRVNDPPTRAYLVQKNDDRKRFVATWEWASTLDTVKEVMTWIDVWKDDNPNLTYRQYARRFPAAFSASDDASCFFSALRLACVVLGDSSLVTRAVLDEFIAIESARGISFDRGTSKDDIHRLISFLIERRASLACQQFRANRLVHSVNSWRDLDEYTLDPGAYVVGAADARGFRHCFVLRVPDHGNIRLVHDDLDEESEVTYSTERLSNLR